MRILKGLGYLLLALVALIVGAFGITAWMDRDIPAAARSCQATARPGLAEHAGC